MVLSVKNSRGDTYFLHSRLTKKGNLSYHFSKNAEGAAEIQVVPEGYEIYEEPNGNMYLRKQATSPITADELRLIEEGMKKYSIIEDFKTDVKKDAVYIYQAVYSFDTAPVPSHCWRSINNMKHLSALLLLTGMSVRSRWNDSVI
ncbi:hypothetical protein EVU96_12555 [Bacillus infantis]|uniref:hypothetical protein n=1 Tax=Bacillus infantis TaxID=324767 RepID=UPI00101D5768|nr:hypothetical protein [Bacillus infantis]RYI28759.1 hypothetical protein EVU96_12555 [Bacillus infantis]